LIDTWFEANMRCREIDAWGGEAHIKRIALTMTHDYISTVER